MSLLTVCGFAVMIACTVAANLLLKSGAMLPASSRIVFGVFSLQSVAGLAMFGCSGLVYAIVLRRVPLSAAQVVAAAQFIGVILAARLLLQEPISAIRWVGVALTCLGIVIVGATANE